MKVVHITEEDADKVYRVLVDVGRFLEHRDYMNAAVHRQFVQWSSLTDAVREVVGIMLTVRSPRLPTGGYAMATPSSPPPPLSTMPDDDRKPKMEAL